MAKCLERQTTEWSLQKNEVTWVRPPSFTEIEFVANDLARKKTVGPDDFTGEF